MWGYFCWCSDIDAAKNWNTKCMHVWMHHHFIYYTKQHIPHTAKCEWISDLQLKYVVFIALDIPRWIYERTRSHIYTVYFLLKNLIWMFSTFICVCYHKKYDWLWNIKNYFIQRIVPSYFFFIFHARKKRLKSDFIKASARVRERLLFMFWLNFLLYKILKFKYI